jgi:hypothetical protein
MLKAWKSGKKFNQLEEEDKKELTNSSVFESTVESLLNRTEFVLIDKNIYSDAQNIAELIVENGELSVDQAGKNIKRCGINITYDIGKKTGTLFKKFNKRGKYPETKESETDTTKAYVSFDVEDAFNNIIKGEWNKEKDGYITTFCATD